MILTQFDNGKTCPPYDDANGYYRVVWRHTDGRVICHKFTAYIPDTGLDAAFEIVFRDIDYGGVPRMEFDWTEAVIKDAVVKLRNNPALTLNQYNQYLNGKPWNEAAEIRAFVYKLALYLAREYEVVLADYTESQVLLKVRNWIVGVNVNVLKKVVFGKFLNI